MLGLFKNDRLIGMVTGFIIWSIYFVIAYSYLSILCEKTAANAYFVDYLFLNHEKALTDAEFIGIDMISFGLAMITLVTLILIISAALVSWRQWRLARARQQELHQFMTFTAFLVYGLSFVATLWVGIPIFMGSPPCL